MGLCIDNLAYDFDSWDNSEIYTGITTTCKFTTFSQKIEGGIPHYSVSKWSELCEYEPYDIDKPELDHQDEICRTYAVTSSMIAMLVIAMVLILFAVMIEMGKILKYQVEIERVLPNNKCLLRFIANIVFMISTCLIFGTVILWSYGDRYCHGDDRYWNLEYLGSSSYFFIIAGCLNFVMIFVAI